MTNIISDNHNNNNRNKYNNNNGNKQIQIHAIIITSLLKNKTVCEL